MIARPRQNVLRGREGIEKNAAILGDFVFLAFFAPKIADIRIADFSPVIL